MKTAMLNNFTSTHYEGRKVAIKHGYKYGITRQRSLNLPIRVKTAITLASTILIMLIWVLAALPTGPLQLVTAIIATVITAVIFPTLMYGVWRYCAISTATPYVSSLTDEAQALAETMTALNKVRALTPEGSGYAARINEFGRLSFGLLQQVERLPKVKASNKAFWKFMDEIRTEMDTLADSGRSLVDLISNQRGEATLDSVRHLGVSAYTEHISVETAQFRSLESGEKK